MRWRDVQLPAEGDPPAWAEDLFTILRARAMQGKNKRGSGVYEW